MILLLAALGGCTLNGASVNDSDGPECNPSGRASIRTGVWLGDQGCGSVDLILSNTGEYGSLNVAYNDHMSGMPLVFWNRSTGDHEREALFSGYPEFTLWIGDFPLSGLELSSGVNEIQVYEWPCVSIQCLDEVPFDELTVFVGCRDADGGAVDCP